MVVFTDSTYEIAVKKARAMEALIKQCGDSKVLAFIDTPLAEASTRMPQLTTSLLQKYGKSWTHSLSINDLTFDFMAPSLGSAGIDGDGAPLAVSAGAGSAGRAQAIAERLKSRSRPFSDHSQSTPARVIPLRSA